MSLSILQDVRRAAILFPFYAASRNITITYPEMEHLDKPLHHAMKTALFPLFFFTKL